MGHSEWPIPCSEWAWIGIFKPGEFHSPSDACHCLLQQSFLAGAVRSGADEPAHFVDCVQRVRPLWTRVARDESIKERTCQEPGVVVELDVVDQVELFVELILDVCQTDTSR